MVNSLSIIPSWWSSYPNITQVNTNQWLNPAYLRAPSELACLLEVKNIRLVSFLNSSSVWTENHKVRKWNFETWWQSKNYRGLLCNWILNLHWIANACTNLWWVELSTCQSVQKHCTIQATNKIINNLWYTKVEKYMSCVSATPYTKDLVSQLPWLSIGSLVWTLVSLSLCIIIAQSLVC